MTRTRLLAPREDQREALARVGQALEGAGLSGRTLGEVAPELDLNLAQLCRAAKSCFDPSADVGDVWEFETLIIGAIEAA